MLFTLSVLNVVLWPRKYQGHPRPLGECVRNTGPWNKSVTHENRVPSTFLYPLICHRECPTLASVCIGSTSIPSTLLMRLTEETRGCLAVTAQDNQGRM